ncbi:unnamed protein product [Arctogadus glacialis]
MEEEALRTYYTRMFLSVRSKLSKSSPTCLPRQEREKHIKHREEARSLVSQPNAQDRTEENPIGFGKQVVRVEDMASDHRRSRKPAGPHSTCFIAKAQDVGAGDETGFGGRTTLPFSLYCM